MHARQTAANRRRGIGLALGTCVLALGLVACNGAGATDLGSLPPPLEATPAGPVPGVEAPPDAWMQVEGGDPVTGELGSYTWGSTGSAAPWLRGAPISVGVGERLELALDPFLEIESWSTRFVPYENDAPTGAVSLGSGVGDPGFPAPPAGTWTVEVTVVFADGQGDARYAWAVRVE